MAIKWPEEEPEDVRELKEELARLLRLTNDVLSGDERQKELCGDRTDPTFGEDPDRHG